MEPLVVNPHLIALKGQAALSVYLNNYQISSLDLVGGLAGLGSITPNLDWDAVLDSEDFLMNQNSSIVVLVDIEGLNGNKMFWVTSSDLGSPLMDTLLDIASGGSGELSQDDMEEVFELYGLIVTSMHAAHEGHLAWLLSSE